MVMNGVMFHGADIKDMQVHSIYHIDTKEKTETPIEDEFKF